MSKRLVIVGGGHAHLTLLMKIADFVKGGYHITLVNPTNHHYYSGMGPGLLSDTYKPWDVRFNVRKMAVERGAEFIRDKVTTFDPNTATLYLESGLEVQYDAVSFNTGSSVPVAPYGGSSEGVYSVKPIINLLKAQRAILETGKSKPIKIVVVGGGPAGVELTGAVRRLTETAGITATITLVSGSGALTDFPDKAQQTVDKSYGKRGISIFKGHLKTIEDHEVQLAEGRRLPFDFLFVAVGVKPSPIFEKSGLPVGLDGGMLVNDKLHAVDYPNVFGGGDCISLKDRPLDKVGVYAVRENPILVHNLMATLKGEPLTTFTPQDTYMLIFNLGDGTGVLVRNSLCVTGKLVFKLKDYIDRSFMNKYQVSDERQNRSIFVD